LEVSVRFRIYIVFEILGLTKKRLFEGFASHRKYDDRTADSGFCSKVRTSLLQG
jgi:hypothetical protein